MSAKLFQRVPHITKHLTVATRSFLVQFLNQRDLSFEAFTHWWIEYDMPSIHSLCPDRVEYAHYLQIVYYVMLDSWLFIDFSAFDSVPLLASVPFQEVRCLICLVSVMFSIFIVYSTQSIHRLPGCCLHPIRISPQKLQDLLRAVNTIEKTCGHIGQDVSVMFTYMQNNGAFLIAEYQGPVAWYFVEQRRLQTLRRQLSANDSDITAPWSNIDEWVHALTIGLGYDRIYTMIFSVYQDRMGPPEIDKDSQSNPDTVSGLLLDGTSPSNVHPQQTDAIDLILPVLSEALVPSSVPLTLASSESQAAGERRQTEERIGHEDPSQVLSMAEYITHRLHAIQLQIQSRREAIVTRKANILALKVEKELLRNRAREARYRLLVYGPPKPKPQPEVPLSKSKDTKEQSDEENGTEDAQAKATGRTTKGKRVKHHRPQPERRDATAIDPHSLQSATAFAALASSTAEDSGNTGFWHDFDQVLNEANAHKTHHGTHEGHSATPHLHYLRADSDEENSHDDGDADEVSGGTSQIDNAVGTSSAHPRATHLSAIVPPNTTSKKRRRVTINKQSSSSSSTFPALSYTNVSSSSAVTNAEDTGTSATSAAAAPTRSTGGQRRVMNAGLHSEESSPAGYIPFDLQRGLATTSSTRRRAEVPSSSARKRKEVFPREENNRITSLLDDLEAQIAAVLGSSTTTITPTTKAASDGLMDDEELDLFANIPLSTTTTSTKKPSTTATRRTRAATSAKNTSAATKRRTTASSTSTSTSRPSKARGSVTRINTSTGSGSEDDNDYDYDVQPPPHASSEHDDDDDDDDDDGDNREESEAENEEERTLRSLEQMIAAVRAQFTTPTTSSTAFSESLEDPTPSNTTSRTPKRPSKTPVGRKRMRTMSPSTTSTREPEVDNEGAENNGEESGRGRGGGRGGGRGRGARGGAAGRGRAVKTTTKAAASSATAAVKDVSLRSSTSSLSSSTAVPATTNTTVNTTTTAPAFEHPALSIAAMLAELEGLTESVLSTHLPSS